MATAARDVTRLTRTPRLVTALAQQPHEVSESLALRHRVFVREMGARVENADSGLERDAFDAHCRHLLVRDTWTGAVVASTRILTDDRIDATGGFYSAGEFDLDAVLALPGRFMEIGRTCVHPDYRRGGVIAILWSGVSELIRREGYQHLIGCASIELDQSMGRAHAIYRYLADNHMGPASQRVSPRLALPAADAITPPGRLPPLLKAYISLGARVGGPPCWDPDFGVADLFMHLDVANLCPRYARHFLHRQPVPARRMAAIA